MAASRRGVGSRSFRCVASGALFALAFEACDPATATEVVARIDTDAPRTEVLGVEVEAREGASNGRIRLQHSYDTTTGEFALPGDVGIVASTFSDSSTLHVRVTARLSRGREITRRAVVTFQPRRIIAFDVFLAVVCADPAAQACPEDLTCGATACESIYPPTYEIRLDAGRDATVRDIADVRDVTSIDTVDRVEAAVDSGTDIAADLRAADTVREVCAPTCATLRACGDDGCGSPCGTCARGIACVAGQCECPPGFANCSDSCVDLSSDGLHCGGCGVICPPDRSCIASECACATGRTGCPVGASMPCVDTATDPAHCGSCAVDCATVLPGSQTTTCGATGCELQSCIPLRADCSAWMAGCEAVVGSNASCGQCGAVTPCTGPGVFCVPIVPSALRPTYACCVYTPGCMATPALCQGLRPTCFISGGGMEFCCPAPS